MWDLVMVGNLPGAIAGSVIGTPRHSQSWWKQVPLDPGYPQERLAFMLEVTSAGANDTAAPTGETSGITPMPPNGQKGNQRWLRFHLSAWFAWTQVELLLSKENLKTRVMAENLNTIYLQVVSRKVQIAHRAVVNFLNSMRQEPGLTNQDVLLGHYHILRYCRTELYLPLIVGAFVSCW